MCAKRKRITLRSEKSLFLATLIRLLRLNGNILIILIGINRKENWKFDRKKSKTKQNKYTYNFLDSLQCPKWCSSGRFRLRIVDFWPKCQLLIYIIVSSAIPSMPTSASLNEMKKKIQKLKLSFLSTRLMKYLEMMKCRRDNEKKVGCYRKVVNEMYIIIRKRWLKHKMWMIKLICMAIFYVFIR